MASAIVAEIQSEVMKNCFAALATTYFTFFAFTGLATVHYVDLNGTNPVSPFTNWATAATNIQDAVDAASPADQILVTNGVYQNGASANSGSNRVNVAKAVMLQSVNGPAVTIIKGYQVPGTITGPSSVRCVFLGSGATLSGFTLTNGSASGNGGGVYCWSSSSVVSNCVITGNYAGSNGGGTASGTHINCVISGNTSSFNGGGNYGGSFTNCVLSGNSTGSEGGGTYYPQYLVNCTVVGNHAGSDGGGVYAGTLANCIVYYNTSGFGMNIENTTSVYNCCTFPTNFMSGLNYTNPPAFVNPAGGDFHLPPWSPCVNAGNNPSIASSTDLDGNPRIVGGTVDVGAYENQIHGTVYYVSVSNTAPVSPFTNWVTAATNIQDAIDAASAGDSVFVTNGVYATGGRMWFDSGTNRVTVTNSLTVQSVNGPAVTFIRGAQVAGTVNLANAVRCVGMGNNAVLSGFTLTNGEAGAGNYISGGGVAGIVGSGAVVTNCILVGNLASNSDGGGAYRVTLINCQLINNYASYGGGASSSALTGCVVSNNITGIYGGGIYLGVANNSLIINNRATIGGGGAYGGALNNCLLAGNFTGGGGGGSGGGAYNGTLNNCTVVSNTATAAGGGTKTSTLNNCIVYYNTAGFSSLGDNYNGTNLNYCCTTPLATNGFGNITNEPAFVNLVNGDFHLRTNSPCINAGNNSYVTNATDLDGGPRIRGGTVDIGAYEVQSPASMISYAYLQQYGLPMDGSADSADPDGDGFNNWQEWHTGTVPTSAFSLLQMFPPANTNNSSGVTISWQSVSGVNYFIQRGSNLSAQPPFSILQSNLVGQAGSTSYTDTTATNSVSYFYRVGVQ
jgi:hypothetical protein